MNKEPIEAVAEALHERDKLGFAVVNVIKKLDEISENVQEIELDDILQVAIPMDDWAALQDALDGVPERAESYSPNSVTIPKDELELLRVDAERYRYWRNRLIASDFDYNNDNTGECMIILSSPSDINYSPSLDYITEQAMLKNEG